MREILVRSIGALAAWLIVSGTHAAAVTYTDKTAFINDSAPLNLEDFNSQTEGSAFHSNPLDIGPFTISMTGTPVSDPPERNAIDAPPVQFPEFDVDGTTIANVLTNFAPPESLFLTFDVPIAAFGVDLANLNDDELRTEIIAAGVSTIPSASGGSAVRFFGIRSDTQFTTVEFRAILNNGYGMDNVLFAVPVPAAVWLFGSAYKVCSAGCDVRPHRTRFQWRFLNPALYWVFLHRMRPLLAVKRLSSAQKNAFR